MKVMVTGHQNGISHEGWTFVYREFARICQTLDITVAFSGMGLGTDLAWAREVLGFGIPLHAYIFPSQCAKWRRRDVDQYIELLCQAELVKLYADKIYLVESPLDLRQNATGDEWSFNRQYIFDRNSAMVEDCDAGVVVYDNRDGGGTTFTLGKLREAEKPYVLIDPARKTTVASRGAELKKKKEIFE